MASKICLNRSRETMTSTNCMVIARPWRAILAPILTSPSRSFVGDDAAGGLPEIDDGFASVNHFWRQFRHPGDNFDDERQNLLGGRVA